VGGKKSSRGDYASKGRMKGPGRRFALSNVYNPPEVGNVPGHKLRYCGIGGEGDVVGNEKEHFVNRVG